MNDELAVRLLKEKLYLHGNMLKLKNFLDEPENTRDISPRELNLMGKQLDAMKAYYDALNHRCYYHANDRAWPDKQLAEDGK